MNKQEALNRLTSLENEINELRKIIEELEKVSPEQRFWQLLEGIEIKIDFEKYPNTIIVFKNGKYYGEYNFKNGYFSLSYYNLWSVFEKEYGMNFAQIQTLIKNEIEKHFNCKDFTPTKIGIG